MFSTSSYGGINVALFDTSETPVDATDRAVLRIALNINEAPALGDTVYFSQRGPLAPGDVQVATLQSLHDGRGCSAGGLLSFNGDFYATPEPASAVLLSLGGLACLRRRRPQLRATLAAGQ